ncbi:MAG: ArsB/NhaD family transporter, partial [Victivallaceae bacterium]|nr:ArsB/NhaD family transporter [Victivallaceae bacterium]
MPPFPELSPSGAGAVYWSIPEMLLFWFGTVVFFGTYALIASEKIHKTAAALMGATLMMLFVLPGPHEGGGEAAPNRETAQIEAAAAAAGTGAASIAAAPENNPLSRKAAKYDKLDTFARYSNFDVVFTLAGMMLLVNLLSGTGLFQYVAIKCAKLAKGSPIRTMILLVLATAGLSAFLDNVTTILLVAPVTLLVCSQLGVPVIPFLMAETMSSNIGGTATLIGDPPNLIIGNAAGLGFLEFIINLFPFISVVVGLYCCCLWLHYSKRMHVTVEKRAAIMELNEKAAISDRSNLKRGGAVMIVTIIGFFLHGAVGLQPCVVAMAGASLALVTCKVNVDHMLEKIEWSTLFLFMGLFILVCGAEQCGLMEKIGTSVGLIGNWPVPAVLLTVMWGSAMAAAVMNNVSFTAAMVAVIAGFIQTTPAFAADKALSDLLWWALALGVCLGGNATLVGAAANLVTVGIAEKNGMRVPFREFMKYGVPVTFGTMV